MEYVIGIDGGGTKTLLKIADLQGNLKKVCKSGPCNINSMSRGSVESTLKNIIYKSIKEINEDIKNCKAVSIGCSGVDRPGDDKIIINILKHIGIKNKIIVNNDAVTALYGGVSGGEGIILISGTGSICFGRNKYGKTCRAGGWGHIFGDEGSGYDIGIKALKYIVRSYDGRDLTTSSLQELVLSHLKLNCPEDLINYIYRSNIDKKDIADIAKVVYEGYKLGDNICKKILIECAEELYICTLPVIEKLGFTNKNIDLVVNGGVIVKNNYVFNIFSECINKKYPRINVSKIKNDAAWGAVLIALKEVQTLNKIF